MSAHERQSGTDAASESASPARGMILGLSIGLVMWTALIAFFWFFFHRR